MGGTSLSAEPEVVGEPEDPLKQQPSHGARRGGLGCGPATNAVCPAVRVSRMVLRSLSSAEPT